MTFISKIPSLALVAVFLLVPSFPAIGSQSLDADVDLLKAEKVKLEKALVLEKAKVKVLRMNRRQLIIKEALRTTCQTNDCDGDGFKKNKDCNDFNALINPDAEEISGNYEDENCDGLLADQDSDGVNYYDEPPDCDDLDPTSYPNATEVPDYADNDCDGYIDETF
jgi:hypothetical protein